MVVVHDHDAFFVYYGLPFAIIAWIAACFTRAVRILQLAVTTQVALLLYFVIHSKWPTVFTTGSLVMAGALFATVFGILGLLYCAVVSAVYVGCLTIGVPILLVNSAILANMLDLPVWGGALVFISLIAAVAALLLVSRLLHIAGLVSKVLVTSILLWLHARITDMENPPDFDQPLLACGSEEDPPGRCPLLLDSPMWISILVAIMVVQVALVFRCGCCKWLSRDEKDRHSHTPKTKPKLKTKPVNAKEPYEPVQTSADTHATETKEEEASDEDLDLFEQEIEQTEKEQEQAVLLCRSMRKRFYAMKYARCTDGSRMEDEDEWEEEEESKKSTTIAEKAEANKLRIDDKYT